ncbi:MAG: DUF424 domain-containing protein [Candidatus Odinarchaeia archaeon]
MDCYLKKTRVDNDIVVAVCDKEVLGKKFKEGKLRLDVSEHFYGGTLITLENAIAEIKASSIANIVGNKIISEAIRQGIVHELSVIKIAGISHVQIIKV